MKQKHHSLEQKSFILIIFFGILIFLLVGRLFSLQVIKASYYKKISEENRLRLINLPAPRGLIFDRNGKIIVSNRPSYTVSIIPYEVKNLEEVVKKLVPLLNVDEEFLKEKIKSNWSNRYEPIKLKRDVDFGIVCILEEQSEDFPGVIYQMEQTRKYPNYLWASHLIGYVSEVSKEEIEKNPDKNYKTGTYIGKRGIENRYDELLRGKDGTVYIEVTAFGKVLGPLKDKEQEQPLIGADLKLTVDENLQIAAESALVDYPSASVVALDPRDGEVLCFFSKPGFDANLFSGFLSVENWNQLLNDPLKPLLNRCIQSVYPPGSTLKLLTAGAALESQVVTPETYFSSCYGYYNFGTRTFRCWKPEGHGRLNLIPAIVQSCDVYFYQLGLKLGLEKWGKYAAQCGFGQKTGIDLPDEAKGIAPTLEYYRKRYGEASWWKNLVINLAIGQGEISVTPLQLACFYCGLANQGIIYKPQLLKEIITPQKRIFKPEKKELEHLPFNPATLELLKTGLIGVVNEPQGTGQLAKLPNVVVAGKTGTAQNPHGEDHAWFVGFAPAENPEIVVAVLVENAGHGGTWAAPIAKKILEKYFSPKESVESDSLVS